MELFRGTMTMSDEEPELTEQQEQYVECLDMAGNAISALSCPWYNGRGTCVSGCYDEPQCQTGAPSGGWVAQLFGAASAIKEMDEEMQAAMSEPPDTVQA